MPMRKRRGSNNNEQCPTEYLDTIGACIHLNVSRAKFYEMQQDYPLKAFRFGAGTIRYRRADLDEWAENWNRQELRIVRPEQDSTSGDK